MAEKLETLKLYSGDYKTNLNRYHRGRKAWEPVNPKLVLSFMPGNVVEYKVKAGDKVKKGDTLLLFRAMKMNNIIKAHADATIKALGAEPGANIPKNALLIEFE